MKYNICSILILTFMLGGCSAQSVSNGIQNVSNSVRNVSNSINARSDISGSYTEKPLNRNSYFIRYDSSSLVGRFVSHDKLTSIWNRRAKELCGSNDYYQEAQVIRVDAFGNESSIGTPAIYGVAYCNNNFIDTRKQSHEENFLQYINLPNSAITYRELSPLWGMLTSKKYEELQKEVDRLHSVLNEDEVSGLLDTFSRVNPAAEEYLTEWVSLYPDSFLALYSRSLFYHNYSWFKRGNTLWKDVTDEQKAGLNKYRTLAREDLELSLKLNPGFCPSHSLNLHIYTSIRESKGEVFEEVFRIANKHCPESIGIHKAYLRYLLPRWTGSKEKMRAHIDESKDQYEQFEVLEALYLAEEGDQLLFDEEFGLALEKYNEAISFGEFPAIYHQRALALENLGRYVEAIEDYDMAVKLSPYYNSAYEGLTRVLLKQNNLVGSLLASSYLTAMNNQDSGNFEREGNIFYHMRRYEDALVSYKKAAILSSNKAVHRHKIRMTEYQIKVRNNEKDNKAIKTVI